jgi:hypothetical protein
MAIRAARCSLAVCTILRGAADSRIGRSRGGGVIPATRGGCRVSGRPLSEANRGLDVLTVEADIAQPEIVEGLEPADRSACSPALSSKPMPGASGAVTRPWAGSAPSASPPNGWKHRG